MEEEFLAGAGFSITTAGIFFQALLACLAALWCAWAVWSVFKADREEEAQRGDVNDYDTLKDTLQALACFVIVIAIISY